VRRDDRVERGLEPRRGPARGVVDADGAAEPRQPDVAERRGRRVGRERGVEARRVRVAAVREDEERPRERRGADVRREGVQRPLVLGLEAAPLDDLCLKGDLSTRKHAISRRTSGVPREPSLSTNFRGSDLSTRKRPLRRKSRAGRTRGTPAGTVSLDETEHSRGGFPARLRAKRNASTPSGQSSAKSEKRRSTSSWGRHVSSRPMVSMTRQKAPPWR
jgi:hypothetical protein